jgi:hypothetical protein
MARYLWPEAKLKLKKDINKAEALLIAEYLKAHTAWHRKAETNHLTLKVRSFFILTKKKKPLSTSGTVQLLKVLAFRIRWAAHFWRVGLRPDFDLNHVGICLIC